MPEENKEKKDIDLSKILLPKKEGPSKDSAQRVNAAVLLEQEQKATLTPTKPADSGYGDSSAKKSPEVLAPSGSQPPSSAVSSSAAPKPQEESLVKPLETYRGAIEQAVQHQNVSVVSIAAAEAKRRGDTAAQEPKAQAQPATPHDLGFTIAAIAGGAVLIAGATALLLFVFFRPQANAPVTVAPQAPFISVDDTRLIAIPPAQWQRNAIMGELNAARESIALSLGLMARLYLAEASTSGALPPSAPPGIFLAAVAPNIPDELLRSFAGEYLLGVHSFDDNQAFLILGVESYEAAYAGMLDWELAMPNELSPLFDRTPRPRIPEEQILPMVPVMILPAATTSTSTPAATSTGPIAPPPEFFRTRFVDRIVENYDARVIQDDNGDILLLWTFLDRNTLVITTNEYTLREIISRRSRPPTITI